MKKEDKQEKQFEDQVEGRNSVIELLESGRDINKFDSCKFKERSSNGVYYLTDKTNAFFSCKVVEQKDLGSHVLFIGEVTEAKVLGNKPPCTYAYYHKAIKPKF